MWTRHQSPCGCNVKSPMVPLVTATHYSLLQIEDIKQHLRLKRTEEEEHQKRISNTRRTIEDLKSELAKVADQPDVTPKINDINNELRRIQVDKARMEGEMSDLRRERENIRAESKSESSQKKNVCVKLSTHPL